MALMIANRRVTLMDDFSAKGAYTMLGGKPQGYGQATFGEYGGVLSLHEFADSIALSGKQKEHPTLICNYFHPDEANDPDFQKEWIAAMHGQSDRWKLSVCLLDITDVMLLFKDCRRHKPTYAKVHFGHGWKWRRGRDIKVEPCVEDMMCFEHPKRPKYAEAGLGSSERVGSDTLVIRQAFENKDGSRREVFYTVRFFWNYEPGFEHECHIIAYEGPMDELCSLEHSIAVMRFGWLSQINYVYRP